MKKITSQGLKEIHTHTHTVDIVQMQRAHFIVLGCFCINHLFENMNSIGDSNRDYNSVLNYTYIS